MKQTKDETGKPLKGMAKKAMEARERAAKMKEEDEENERLKEEEQRIQEERNRERAKALEQERKQEEERTLREKEEEKRAKEEELREIKEKERLDRLSQLGVDLDKIEKKVTPEQGGKHAKMISAKSKKKQKKVPVPVPVPLDKSPIVVIESPIPLESPPTTEAIIRTLEESKSPASESDSGSDWEKEEEITTNQEFIDEDKEELKSVTKAGPKESKLKQTTESAITEEEKKEPVMTDDMAGVESKEGYRCPILCILGHVDTGKTKLLDKIRQTKVQEGEVGGITQQIGASYFPPFKLEENLDKMRMYRDIELKIPGLLIIDTPGHESFSNLRARGSGLCDFAILVVDIMHGIENQTKESILLLKKKKTPFVVALNKIDRCYGWKSSANGAVQDSLSRNKKCNEEFRDRVNKTILAFAELNMNAALYWENEDPRSVISLIPTSAITGEGIPDLLTLIVDNTQRAIKSTIMEKEEFTCTVLEVKKVEGHGVTMDVILVNGELRIGDQIIVNGFQGPILTTIRALLTPQPLREMRVKGDYIHHRKVRGALGVKVSGPGLEEALAGSSLYVVSTPEQIQARMDDLNTDVADIIKKYVNPVAEGVCVQSSTLGSLEALLEFLHHSKIPVASIGIGPVYKKDVIKAVKATQTLEAKEEYIYIYIYIFRFATVLAFDVKITAEGQAFADSNKITIFQAPIIYHLFDMFTAHVEKCKDSRKREKGKLAVFPCVMKMIQGAEYNKKDPIVMGVKVEAGILKVGTPLCYKDSDVWIIKLSIFT